MGQSLKHSAARTRQPSILKISKLDPDRLAKDLFDYCRHDLKMRPAEALQRASELMGSQPYAVKSRIGTMSQSDYGANSERGAMATAVKERPNKKTNGHKSNGHAEISRQPEDKMPSGKDFCERFARGLIRWRKRQGLTKKQAIEKYGINRNAWYRVEQAVSNGLTATHIDTICNAIGVEDTEILILGRSE